MKLPIFAYMKVFPNLFGPRHPYIVLKIFGGTPSWFNWFNEQRIETTGRTPGSSSRDPVWNHCSTGYNFSRNGNVAANKGMRLYVKNDF